MSPFLSAIWQENLKKWQEEKSGRRTFLFLQRGVNGRNNILFKNVEAHNAVTHQKTVSLLKKKQDPLLSARPGKLQPVSRVGRGHSLFYLFSKKNQHGSQFPVYKVEKGKKKSFAQFYAPFLTLLQGEWGVDGKTIPFSPNMSRYFCCRIDSCPGNLPRRGKANKNCLFVMEISTAQKRLPPNIWWQIRRVEIRALQ